MQRGELVKKVGIIPARAGSKGISDKNKLVICGQPLISWTIQAAQMADSVDEIVVSTDDEEVAEIARALGVEVPFMRPPELAQDNTPMIDTVLHVLSLVEGIDSVILLQPTSPMRTPADIDAIVELALVQRATSAVSVCETKGPINWNYTIQEDGKLRPLLEGKKVHRRQDAQLTYSLNGALYYFEVPWILESKTFIDNETWPYIMPQERSIDIDSEFDWKIAEFLLSCRGT
jgi:CMP-N,N'-diacetyllegionaminic acid synthase